MTTEEFERYWESLDEEMQENIKQLVIARLKQIPDNFRMSLG